MKKIVRLTESDLVRLVKRVISEQLTQMGTGLKKRQDLIGKSFKKDGKENEFFRDKKTYNKKKNDRIRLQK